MDKDLKVLLGSVRKKTWALVVMLFAAAIFVQSHTKHDLEQEKEIWRLLIYITHLEHKTSTYYQRIRVLEGERHICIPP